MPNARQYERYKDRRRYRKVLTRMHADDKFQALSRPGPNGQSLWQYLITGPHTTSIPGLFCAGEAMLAEALGWDLKGFRKSWKEIESRKMAVADWTHRVVWLPRAIAHNEPESQNVVKHWEGHFVEIPDCPLKATAWAALKAYMEYMGPAFAEAFRVALPRPASKPLRHTPGFAVGNPSVNSPANGSASPSAGGPVSGSTNGTAMPSASASGIQEQEQEQDVHTHPARETGMQGGGVAGGTLPREHLKHAWCGNYRKCVPDFLHGEFVRAVGGDPEAARVVLVAFYEGVMAAIPDAQPIGDEPLRFWRAHFAAHFPSAAPSGRLARPTPSGRTGAAAPGKYAGVTVTDGDDDAHD